MNNEEQNTEVKQLMDSLVCEHLDDEKFCQFHHAVLELVSTAVKEQTLVLPMELYCKYKGFVGLSCKIYRKMQIGDWGDMPSDHLKEMYYCYRKQADEQYGIVCRLVASAYQKTISSEEREALKNIINNIHGIIKK